jgi:hypothetical protein
MTQDNSKLAFAFPVAVRGDVIRLAETLPQPSMTAYTFPAVVGDELVRIPYRVYHDVTAINPTLLNNLQLELLNCLLTGHYNGYVREENLRKILGKNHHWVPPFIVQLVGEYVIEILSAIRDGLPDLDHELYVAFLRSNPEFFNLTKQRVASYRNCYYFHVDKNKYVGCEIVRFLEGLIGSTR